jgi:hypothetical protein
MKNKIIKAKKIIFKPMQKIIEQNIEIPKPSTNHVPQWYRDQKLFSNRTNNFVDAIGSDDYFGTYKLCVPLVDTITSGYTIALDSDVIITNGVSNGYLPKPIWMGMLAPLDFPDGDKIKSIGNYPVPLGYSPMLLRWRCHWLIETPKDYSIWITHPSHRHDLPFFTINGFIDTDKHGNALNLPFFIKAGFEGVIPAGTPIAQIIPVKRDNWESEKGNYVQEELENNFHKLKRYAIRSYKKQWWTRKSYK